HRSWPRRQYWVRFKALLDDPVFNRLQLHRVICGIGAVQGEEINLADWAPIRPHLRHYVRRQSDLTQSLQNAFSIPVVVRFVVEDQFYVGESEERKRTQV